MSEDGDKKTEDEEPLKDPRSARHDDPHSGSGKPKPPEEDGEDEDKDKKKKKKRPVWPLFLVGLVVLIFVIVVLVIIFAPHGDVTTDDAYVTAHYATVAPRVQGQVTAVLVTDNQPVRAGQLLATLDPRDYQTAVLDAQAALQSDQAREAEAAAEVARQPALIAQAQAQVASLSARLGFSSSDAQRYANLAQSGAGTFQQHQQADTTLRQDQASLASAGDEVTAQTRQLRSLEAAEAAASAQVRVDASRLAQAQLNLSYTRITAPLDGTVDQRTIEVGDYVSPGAAMMTVAPLNAAYVLASYREVALRHMAPGQHVRIHLDAYNIDLDGLVDSLAPASGATYSPVPPNNATGNFTKIVQRIPVKIVVSPGQDQAKLLRLGMSVETTVHTGLDDVAAAQAHTPARITAR